MSRRSYFSSIRLLGRLALVLASGLFTGFAHGELHFDKSTINAGVVFSGQRLLQRFAFANRGRDTIVITQVRASCGCLATRLSQRTLKPGDSGSLELEINTLSQPSGPINWNVRLQYQEAGASQEQTVYLSAHLVAEVTVEPAAIVLLAEKASEHAITVIDTRPTPLKIKEVRASLPALQASVAPLSRNEHNHHAYQIKLQVAGELPEGRHDASLAIFTDDPKYGELLVPVTLIKRSPQLLTATPSAVALSAAAGQPFSSRIVLIRDRENRVVRIGRIWAEDPAISCRWAEGPGAHATMRIQVDRGKLQSQSLGSVIHVEITQPVVESLAIPITCTAH